MATIISVVSKFVSEHERPDIHGVRSLITSSISKVYIHTASMLYYTEGFALWCLSFVRVDHPMHTAHLLMGSRENSRHTVADINDLSLI